MKDNSVKGAVLEKHISPHGEQELLDRVGRIRHVALDMDGTIYMGKNLFPFTPDFLTGLRERGIGYSFLTNNPSRNIADYLQKLENMGITATEAEMYTTAIATIDYIKANYPGVERLYILGTPSMVGEFEKAGFKAVDDSGEPEAVVVGFDLTLTYDRLCRACWWIAQGKPYIATNPDLVCPTDEQTVLVDCGSICRAIESATGRNPDIVLGKPDKNMLTGILERNGLRPEEVAMVGDRIYTDIHMARNAGAFGVLVLSGETVLDTVLAEEEKPDLTVRDLAHFAEIMTMAGK